MTKKAMITIFEYIVEQNHAFKAKICNFIYDEIILEVEEILAEEYRVVLENAMCDAGDFFVKHDTEIKLTGTANVGNSWYDVK